MGGGALRRLGEVAGSQRVEDLARQANGTIRQLVLFDRYGHRVDEVEFHPAYHELMRLAYGHEVHSLAWTGDGANPHTARAVLSYLWNQAENGVGCPTGMTYASVDTLRKAPHLRDPWTGKALSTAYDPRPVHVAEEMGITLGMAMTEKQGGSALRKVRTVARPLDGSNDGGDPGGRRARGRGSGAPRLPLRRRDRPFGGRRARAAPRPGRRPAGEVLELHARRRRVAELLECHGGNGFIEEGPATSPLPVAAIDAIAAATRRRPAERPTARELADRLAGARQDAT